MCYVRIYQIVEDLRHQIVVLHHHAILLTISHIYYLVCEADLVQLTQVKRLWSYTVLYIEMINCL